MNIRYPIYEGVYRILTAVQRHGPLQVDVARCQPYQVGTRGIELGRGCQADAQQYPQKKEFLSHLFSPS